MFYTQLLCAEIPIAQKFSQVVSILALLGSGVNFINILPTHFFVQKCFAQLSLVMFQISNFWRKKIGAKFVRKMLMKLAPSVTCSKEEGKQVDK